MAITRRYGLSILGGIATMLLLMAASGLRAQQPKVMKQNGHVSPLMATITSQSGSKRDVMVLGIGSNLGGQYRSHNFIAKSDDGSSDVTLWLDTIKEISETSNEDFSVVLKDGTKRHLLWTGLNCTQQRDPRVPQYDCAFLYLYNPDGGAEIVDMEQIRSVEFLKAPRKDQAGNAMFDNWKYSPFTGEKLPEN